MNAQECRDRRDEVRDQPNEYQVACEIGRALWEIAAQLAELSKKKVQK